jgi:hypothetical protein
VEELSVGSSSNFIDDSWFQIDHDLPKDLVVDFKLFAYSSWNVFGSIASFREERVEELLRFRALVGLVSEGSVGLKNKELRQDT